MQNTRLNRLFDIFLARLGQWLQNPWRRISVLVISLLFGTFLGIAISTIAGQEASWDISVAFILLLLTELVSVLAYRQRPSKTQKSIWIECLNALKMGLSYSLFLLAFLLGS
ncbi:MAG: DUF565 domain-containing protein [Microcoleaceae cyanobacterium]